MAKARTRSAPPSLSKGVGSPGVESAAEPAAAITGSAAPCIPMSFESASEPDSPGSGRRTGSAAALPAASLIVRPSRDRTAEAAV